MKLSGVTVQIKLTMSSIHKFGAVCFSVFPKILAAFGSERFIFEKLFCSSVCSHSKTTHTFQSFDLPLPFLCFLQMCSGFTEFFVRGCVSAFCENINTETLALDICVDDARTKGPLRESFCPRMNSS